ncbi:uncharacterized protein LAESUDRAFT_728180 [Laetiporus sulphureus 93-53]|uniref:Uncharacterized protein n=1 Tax=Laetiporus sulphureus 93-53 TaxID=1314785 RepID=A0A165D8R1_9APHY|nr:uncharacterized protein LAESUDRAFT_728180 [Laetiporus sulphureus 93-53]KZT04347.1 hypothetical protein LAESUDRAFT_728180 [Laetiporus sulphureus 93-53]
MATLRMPPLERCCPRESCVTKAPRLGAVTGRRDAPSSRTAAHHFPAAKESHRQMQQNAGGDHEVRPVQYSAQNASSSRRMRMPPRSVTDILADPTSNNLKTSFGHRGSASQWASFMQSIDGIFRV